jgi:hypothetical protein
MEIITLEDDITVMYVQARSFPEGIMDAHQELNGKMPLSKNRKHFGISRPESGVIRYKAGEEQLQRGEAARVGLKTMTLKKGKYITTTVVNYSRDPSGIRHAFDILLTDPRIDPEGYCVEWYFNDSDVRCMVRLAEKS